MFWLKASFVFCGHVHAPNHLPRKGSSFTSKENCRDKHASFWSYEMYNCIRLANTTEPETIVKNKYFLQYLKLQNFTCTHINTITCNVLKKSDD